MKQLLIMTLFLASEVASATGLDFIVHESHSSWATAIQARIIAGATPSFSNGMELIFADEVALSSFLESNTSNAERHVAQYKEPLVNCPGKSDSTNPDKEVTFLEYGNYFLVKSIWSWLEGDRCIQQATDAAVRF